MRLLSVLTLSLMLGGCYEGSAKLAASGVELGWRCRDAGITLEKCQEIANGAEVNTADFYKIH